MVEASWGQRLLLAVIKLFLVAFAAVLAVVMLCGVFVLFCVWAVRRAWARLTGRPVAPWVLRSDPMAMWRQATRYGRPGAQADPAAREEQQRRRTAVADVTDVTPK